MEKQYHEELKIELQGRSLSKKTEDSSVEGAEAKVESCPTIEQIAKDTDTMSDMMMSRKKRGLSKAIEVTLGIFFVRKKHMFVVNNLCFVLF